MEKEFSVGVVVVQVFSPLSFLTYRMTDCRNSSFRLMGLIVRVVGHLLLALLLCHLNLAFTKNCVQSAPSLLSSSYCI